MRGETLWIEFLDPFLHVFIKIQHEAFVLDFTHGNAFLDLWCGNGEFVGPEERDCCSRVEALDVGRKQEVHVEERRTLKKLGLADFEKNGNFEDSSSLLKCVDSLSNDEISDMRSCWQTLGGMLNEFLRGCFIRCGIFHFQKVNFC